MAKLSIALAALAVAFAVAPFAPARAQSSPRFEYVFVTPYSVMMPVGTGRVEQRTAYRACVAASAEWTCRNFESAESAVFDVRNGVVGPDAALRRTLVTLGSEGWELVSAVDDASDKDDGLTFVFKRPHQ